MRSPRVANRPQICGELMFFILTRTREGAENVCTKVQSFWSAHSTVCVASVDDGLKPQTYFQMIAQNGIEDLEGGQGHA